MLGKKAYEISEMVRRKEVSIKEVVSFFLERIRRYDDKIRGFITVTEEFALKEAERLQKLVDEKKSNLFGVPIAVKDIISTSGIRTTCASKILENYVPPYDATVVEKIRSYGLIIIGKTNLDEFAMGSSTENSAFFPTRNPWDLERVPGGSSGGSAAVVSAYLSPLALGTDTGGSIRQPSAFCGIVGLNPTYGRVSRFGLIAFASSLDRIGPMARCVEDVALLLQIIAGFDERDSTSANIPVPDYISEIKKGEDKKFVVGYSKVEGLQKEVEEMFFKILREIEKIGIRVEEISLPHLEYALPAYYILAPAEASSNLARFDGVKYGVRVEGENILDLYFKTRELFGEEVKRRIIIGTFVLSSGYYDAYYIKAQKVRTLVREDFFKAFKKVDLILSPTAPELPFKIGEKKEDPVKMYLSDVFTIPSSLAGLPAISVPIGLNPLPVGLQIIGKPFKEEEILSFAKIIENMVGEMPIPQIFNS